MIVGMVVVVVGLGVKVVEEACSGKPCANLGGEPRTRLMKLPWPALTRGIPDVPVDQTWTWGPQSTVTVALLQSSVPRRQDPGNERLTSFEF